MADKPKPRTNLEPNYIVKRLIESKDSITENVLIQRILNVINYQLLGVYL